MFDSDKLANFENISPRRPKNECFPSRSVATIQNEERIPSDDYTLNVPHNIP